MSTGFTSHSNHRRKLSPIAKLSKTRRHFWQNGVSLKRPGVEEFNISQIVPDIKRTSEKPVHKVMSKSHKPSRLEINRPSQEMNILISKHEDRSEKELSDKFIKFEEIKVCVTPNGARYNRDSDLEEVIDDWFARSNSDNKEGSNLIFGKLLNNDLEKEINYVPNNKLLFPTRPILFFNNSRDYGKNNDKNYEQASSQQNATNFRYSKIVYPLSKFMKYINPNYQKL